MEYSPIPIPARRDVDNPDELCRTEEFTVVRHSIGNDEEFVTVGPSKISIVERTPGSMSCIYHKLFSRKDCGWEDLAENGIDLMVYSEKCHVLNSHGHSEALINTLFAQTLKMENHPEQTIRGVSSF
ncbi:hypothetical protein Tco_0465285 [Tanacetum coccineum]